MKKIKPSGKLIIQEIRRRDPKRKNLQNFALVRLMSVLELEVTLDKNHVNCDSDINFITTEHNRMVEQQKKTDAEKLECEFGPNESNKKQKVVQISFTDKIRFVEAMCVDEVKELHLETQTAITRQQLDSRNSDSRAKDFHQKLCDHFNDVNFAPAARPHLSAVHPDFSAPQDLPKTDFVLTPAKAKETMSLCKPQIVDIVTRHELSGNGACQRQQSNKDWGHFTLDDCVDGDDRADFIQTPSRSFLLHWWAVLDEEQLLHFTCAVLPDAMTASSDSCPLVCTSKKTHSVKAKERRDVKRQMANNVGKVGSGVTKLAEMMEAREIEAWQKSLFDLELRLMDSEEEEDNPPQSSKSFPCE